MHIEIPNVAIDSIYPDDFGKLMINMSREIDTSVIVNPEDDAISIDENGTVTNKFTLYVDIGCTIIIGEDTTFIES